MFDIHQAIVDEESGEIDEERSADYMEALMKEFAASPEAQPIIEKYGSVGWVHTMMDYALGYVGVNVSEMSLGNFNEVLFELFPRKVSTGAESAQGIVDELQAFWSWVHRQYQLPNAKKILDGFTASTAEKLKKALSNSGNFGMAKSIFMMGQKAGYDMTTQDGLDRFRLAYNSSLLNKQKSALPPAFFSGGDPFSDFETFPAGPPQTSQEREKKRKARKTQRQARKRQRR